MTLYLQINGSTDSLITDFGANTADKVVMDVLFDNPQPNGYAYVLGNTNIRINNGALQFGTGVTGFAFGTRTTMTIDIVANYGNPQSILSVFYRGISGAGFNNYATKGRIYDVKYYSGGNLIAHYDMSTGNSTDQSGNGNNAKLNGGTFIDDGTGGVTPTGTDISVTSVTGNTNVSTIAPSLITQKQVTISNVVANAIATALVHSISTSNSISNIISSITANKTADSTSPIITTQTQNSISSITANTMADGITPSYSSSGNINIIGNVAISNAITSNPIVSTVENISITSAIGTSNTSTVIPQVGSFTNVAINVIAANATETANNLNITVINNTNLSVTTPNTTAIAFIPNVGSSKSTSIASVLASLVVDGIVPSVSISKNNIVTSVVTNTNTDTYKPIIQTDMIISATISGLYTSGLAPILNASNYQQIIKYMLYINRKLEFDLDIKQMLEFNSDIRRKLDFNSDIKSSTNSALKI